MFVQVVLLQFLSDCKVIEFESLCEHVLRSDKVTHCLSVSSFLQRCQRMEVLALGPVARFCCD